MEISGTILEIGSTAALVDDTIADWRVNDRVMATLLQYGGTGGMAEIVSVPVQCVWKLPPALCDGSHDIPDHPTMATCANIGRNYFAAYHSLKTIGQVFSVPSKQAPCLAVGADYVFCYGKSGDVNENAKNAYANFKANVQRAARALGHAQGVDLVVDMVQGNLFEQALISCVRPLGTICLVGFAAGQVPIRPGILLIKEVNVVGSLWGRYASEFPRQHRQNVQEILHYLATRAIRPRVDRIYPLQDFAQAFHLYETNQGRGNTVVSFVDDETRGSRSRIPVQSAATSQSRL